MGKTINAVLETVENVNENASKLTAEQADSIILQCKTVLAEINKENKTSAENAFALMATNDKQRFWNTFLSDRTYTVYSIAKNAKTGEYSVKENARPVAFASVDRKYKEIDGNPKTIATDMAYYRTLSHFTHNLIISMASGVETTNKLTLNDKSKTEIADVDFSKVSIGGMEKQVNAIVRCLIPDEIIGETKLLKADVRHLVDICDSLVKIDYQSSTKNAHIKTKNENTILNEILSVFTMRKAGGNYIVDSKAKAHKQVAKDLTK